MHDFDQLAAAVESGFLDSDFVEEDSDFFSVFVSVLVSDFESDFVSVFVSDFESDDESDDDELDFDAARLSVL